MLGYKGNARQQCVQSRGQRESGVKVVHVVTSSCSSTQLQSLLTTRLLPLSSSGDAEIQVSLSKKIAHVIDRETLGPFGPCKVLNIRQCNFTRNDQLSNNLSDFSS